MGWDLHSFGCDANYAVLISCLIIRFIYRFVISRKLYLVIYMISVQSEKTKIANPTFLEAFYLNFDMPGHFYLWDVVNAYRLGPLAPLHKK